VFDISEPDAPSSVAGPLPPGTERIKIIHWINVICMSFHAILYTSSYFIFTFRNIVELSREKVLKINCVNI
jgi:hypothetical protein